MTLFQKRTINGEGIDIKANATYGRNRKKVWSRGAQYAVSVSRNLLRRGNKGLFYETILSRQRGTKE